MGEVVLARVDARLIHGQVSTNLVNSTGANAIFVADDPSAHDDFAKNVIISAGGRTGQKIRVLKEEGSVRYWNDRQYDNYKVLFMTKTIEAVYKIIKEGVPIKKLNIGGLPQRPGLTPIIKEVAINQEQYDMLKELRDDYDVEVYFQAIPSSTRVELKDVANKFE
ncbi:PTS system mannose/fructose/N-acetylgalactosamine-transporter subunit IIB [Aerococcus urinae]